MAITFTPIASTMFSGHHYDPDTRKLTMKYKNGLRYEYSDVPAEKHAAFVENPSPGRYFSKRIKSTHTGRKVGR